MYLYRRKFLPGVQKLSPREEFPFFLTFFFLLPFFCTAMEKMHDCKTKMVQNHFLKLIFLLFSDSNNNPQGMLQSPWWNAGGFQICRCSSATTVQRALAVCQSPALSMPWTTARSNTASAVCSSRCGGACTGCCSRAGQVV